MNDDELLPSNNPTTQRRSAKTSNASTNEILKAYQVDAYKYINKKYESRGKVGLALLGSKLTNNFNLLLYGKSNVHITQANINPEFIITSTEELYVSFYDIKSENWSLRFDSIEIFNDFLSRMCIYKMLSSSKPDIVIIDLKLGSGGKVQETDLCEIELNMNSIRNCDISSKIYSSDNQEVLRTQIGSNKVMQAIEKGLIGMSKGGYRVIAIPHRCPFMKGGSITIPTETNVIAYIKLIRTKSKVDKPIGKSETVAEVDLPLPDLNFDKQFNPEFETPDKSKKSELLSRMALLGKPIPAYNAEPNNSEIPPKNYNYNQPIPISTHEMNIVHQMAPNMNSYSNIYDANILSQQLLPLHTVTPQLGPVHQIYPQIPNIPPSTDFGVLFTETRQNNTEMRVAMSKLQDKIDRIFDKIDTKTSGSQQQTPTRHMDAENVFENIKRIINENESLKQECTQKSNIIEKQNKRINEMLKNSQTFLDDSHDVIQRNSVSFNSSVAEQQNRILQLEEEKLNLIRNLSQKTAAVSESEQKLEQAVGNAQSYRLKSLEYNEQIGRLTEEIGDLKLKTRSLQTELNDLKVVHDSDSKKQEDLESREKQWLVEESGLRNKIESLKVNYAQLNSRLLTIQSNCDAEISEARQQCVEEVEEWKNKLKLERQRTSNKNSDLLTEIDQANRDWERRFEEYRQNESAKAARLSERNSQLLVENASLQRDVMELTQKLTASGDIQASVATEWVAKNRALNDQLAEVQNELSELANVRTKNAHLESEVIRLEKEFKEQLSKDNGDNEECRMLRRRNEDLQQELSEVQKRNEMLLAAKRTDDDTELGAVENVGEKIKKIMNDVFRRIKSDIDLGGTYSGEEVVARCMTIIRDMTMEHIAGAQPQEDHDEVVDDGGSSDDNTDEEVSSAATEEPEILEIDHTADPEISGNNEQPIDGEEITRALNVADLPESQSSDWNDKTNENTTSLDGLFSMPDKVADDGDVSPLKNVSTEQSEDPDNDRVVVISDGEQDRPPMSHDSSEIIGELVHETEPTEKPNIIVSNPPEESTPVVLDQEIIIPDTNDIHGHSTIDSVVVSVDKNSPRGDNEDALNDLSRTSKKDILLSSDEDDDVLEFFEKLTQKTKNQEPQIKPTKPASTLSDIDDDLSWLNN